MSEITILRKFSELRSYKLKRKRYIPFEEVDISGDKVLYCDDKLLVTFWQPIKPRNDIKEGVSYWFLTEGYKVSKIYDNDGNLKFYYCDIARFEINKQDCEYKVVDLLLDVVVNADLSYEVLDIDELVEAYESKLITYDEFRTSLLCCNNFLKKIKDGEFPFKELGMF